MLFKTIEQIDDAGNSVQRLAWGFKEINKKEGILPAFSIGKYSDIDEVSSKNLFDQSIARDTQQLKDFNELMAKGNITISEAITQLGITKESVVDACNGYKEGKTDIDEYTKAQEAQYKSAQKGAKGISSSMGAMLGNIGAELAIMAAIQAAMKGFQKLDEKFRITKDSKLEAMESAINDYNDALEKTSANIESIRSVEDEFKKLSSGISDSGKNVSLSAEEYSRYNEIVNELISINPELVQGYTNEGQAIIDRNSAIRDGIELQKEYAKEATKDYINSGGEIYDGILQEQKETAKESEKALKESKDALDIDNYYKSFGKVGKQAKRSDIINEVLGEDVDLNNLSMDQMLKISEKKEEILATAKSQKNVDEDELAILEDQLDVIDSQSSSYRQNASELANYLKTVVMSSEDYGGKGISVANEYLDEYSEAVQKIAEDSSLSLDEMIDSTVNLANELNRISSNGTLSRFTEDIKDAQNVFENSDKTERDIGIYNDAVQSNIESIEELADTYADTMPEMQKFLDDLADSYRDFASRTNLDISEVFNTAASEIESARTVKDTFDALTENGDYYTAINAFEEIYDAMYDGVNNLGRGSISWWEGAEMILGSARLSELEYDFKKVNAAIKELKPTMNNSASAANKFGQMLWEASEEGSDGARVITDEFGEIVATIEKTSSGGIAFDIDNENLAVVAEQLGVSRDYLVAMLDSARQFSNVTWDDTKDVAKAIENMSTSWTAKGETWQFYETVQAEAERAGVSATEFAAIAKKVVDDTDTNFIRLDDDAKTLMSSFAQMSDTIASYKENSDGSWEGILDAEAFVTQMELMGRSAEDTMKLLKRIEKSGEVEIEGIDTSSIEDFVADKYLELQDLELGFDVSTDERLIDSNDRLIDALDRNTLAQGGTPELTLKEDIQAVENSLASYSKAYSSLSADDRATYESNILDQIDDLEVARQKYQQIIDDAESGIIDLDDTQLKAYKDALKGTGKEVETLKAVMEDLQDGKLDLYEIDENGNFIRNTNKAAEAVKYYSEDLDTAIQKANEFANTNWDKGQYGNVNVYDRPWIFNEDGTYSTIKSETFAYKDFGIEQEGYFNVTPILPNGKELTHDELVSHIEKQLGKGRSLNDLKIFAGGYNTEAEAEAAANEMHELSDEYAGEIADIIMQITDLWEQLSDAEKKKLGLEELDFSKIKNMEDLENLLDKLQNVKVKIVDKDFKKAIKAIDGLSKKDRELVIEAVTDYENGGTLKDLVSDIQSVPEETRAKVIAEITNAGGFDQLLSGLNNEDREIVITALTTGQGNVDDLNNAISKLPDDVESEVKLLIDEASDNLAYYKGELIALDEMSISIAATGSEDVIASANELNDKLTKLSDKEVEPEIEIDKNKAEKIYNKLDDNLTDLGNTTYSPTFTITDYASATLAKIKRAIDAIKFGGDIVVNIAGSVLGAHKGTPSSPFYRSHSSFPSMAKGGRLGPQGHGGLTLTGELGTELVWIPSQSRSFLVGQYGPEMVNLPGDAVVYPADETRKILGDTISPGRLRFGTGSMALGNAKFGSAVDGVLGGSDGGSGGGSGSGKGRSSSSSSKSDEFKEVFDWIEIAIDRIERAIDRLDLKASSVFKSWATRNAALKDQISEVRKEIDLQQAGYNRYIQQANSVGLDESWAKLVREGKVDISTIKDEALAEKIKEYQEW